MTDTQPAPIDLGVPTGGVDGGMGEQQGLIQQLESQG